MSITVVSNEAPSRVQQWDGRFLRRTTLAVSGLTAGSANTIPHNLGTVPQTVKPNPGASGLWGVTQPADATNIYITVGGGGATSGFITCWF